MDPELLVVLPDQQVPYHDPHLHELVCEWLRFNQPQHVVISGDLVDFTSIGVHRKDVRPEPGKPDAESLQEGIDTAYRVLSDYRDAVGSECRDLRFVPGNHEQRLQAYLMRNAEALADIRQGNSSSPVLTVSSLLRLGELGYEWITAPVYGPDYPHAQATITPNLAVRHGWLARQGAGATALKTLETLSYSIIVGHTHRQAIVHKTYHQIDGSLRTLQAVEAGTLAKVRGGLGYAVAPDWTPGFATAWLWPDGTFKTELATYVNGVLLWGNQRYGSPRKRHAPRGSRLN